MTKSLYTKLFIVVLALLMFFYINDYLRIKAEVNLHNQVLLDIVTVLQDKN